MVTSVAGNSASASSARSLMARFEYLTKSSEEVEASLIFVNKILCAFREEEMTRFGWRSDIFVVWNVAADLCCLWL